MRHIIQSFAIVERILRDRISYFAEIGRHEDLSSKIVDMLIITLLGLGLFGVAMGATGGLRSMILMGWIGLFGIVGTQMAWALRPFVSAPRQPFELIRESQGTFYSSVFYLLLRLFGFQEECRSRIHGARA